MQTIRPLVTGSNGLLGQAVTERFETVWPETVSSTREFLDLEDFWRLRSEMERLAPTLVVNCAAYSDVDGCERHPDRAFRENRDAPVNLARACRAMGIPLVHISTDYVFDGRASEPYREEDAPGPLSVYGESMWEGEREVMREHPDSLIVRTSFLVGPGRPGFLQRSLESAARGERVRAVIDWVNAPTHTRDLAEAIERLARLGSRGLVHFTNQPACSKLEFAREVLRAGGFDPALAEPVRRADLQLPAPRPERTPLDLSRYISLTGAVPRTWQAAIAEHLAGVPS
jgi:dTDP-4-dehydrorhamnose reductase